MSSVNPRASGLWSSSRMSYVSVAESYDEGGEEVDIEGLGFEAPDDFDGRTPLDRTIDRIGMGSYQWTLLCLCGFGWLADNMWIQAIAIILPRVQQHFSVSDSFIGTLSSSMFGGMMFGAVGWGTCSDLMGRTTAFNATLFLTSVFGVFAALAGSFPLLCFALFLLGSAVGGSMPTDGTLLLEHMPNGKQYLVTALSVFFSFGAVLAAVIGLVVIPGHSCPPAPATCDVDSQNMGWKYLLIALGLVTLTMFIARIVFFRLHESPRYLVHAGRPHEAIESLQLISKFNGSELSLDLDDIEDTVRPAPPEVTGIAQGDQQTNKSPSDPEGGSNALRDATPDSAQYSSMGSPDVALDSHSFGTPLPHTTSATHVNNLFPPTPQSNVHQAGEEAHHPPRSRMPSSSSRRMSRRLSTASSYIESKSGPVCKILPRWIRRPALAWIDRVAMVLSPEWLRTTLLVWAVWCAMSLAYTMFNVYLPKLLETRSPSRDPGGAPRSLEDSLWDVVIYSLGGCPGALLGAWLIESRLGRRWSLAGSTFVTAFFCWVFVMVEHPWAVRASTVGISLSATAMWAVLYGWTPEIFGTKVRGTACGIASALSRIGGMIAPIVGGSLLMVDHSFPVYASIGIFVVAGICVLLLEEHEGERGNSRVLAH
ncbi:MFS general substrate transporter [Lentinus tigrinus ALCF2SS1-7]|uniref:MFS general substrate transporter n=1 Tax=Lentinus tigrinus ALCF2SS1-6 TaxID=1328759 RepID=A0A5C2SFH0_9APHY|nr:MFS general substrate transporter [Lentinus tigrinus ALCF2SS1-6]RPD77722.1 MFS general substrate transporter [Lentinus tigrinus ALCF2SS1-7]